MPKPKRKRGRPHIKLDLDLLKQLCSIQCTMKELAACMDCSVDTLERNYADVIDKAREGGKKSLRRLQFEHAKKYWGMALFLGKIYLGQKEAVDGQTYYTKIIAERSAPDGAANNSVGVVAPDKANSTIAK